MTFDTRFTWEKLVLELKLLRKEDFGHLAALAVGINAVLWPKENLEPCFRQVQFFGFQVLNASEGMPEAERWESLRRFIFEQYGFQLSNARRKDIGEREILMKHVLETKVGHPLPIVFLLLHLANFLDIPMALIQARHHFLLKWVRSGRCYYLDLYNEGQPLTDQEVIQFLNQSSSNLEVWSARQLLTQYLELLMNTFQCSQNLPQLHVVYNLMLQLDDTNTTILGQRALLRHKLGFLREATTDLKRYFSFVERAQAPTELQQVWLELEAVSEAKLERVAPTEFLH